MKMREVAEVALKILGLYCIVEAALKIPVLGFLLRASFSHPEVQVAEGHGQVMVQSPDWDLATQSGQFAIYLLGGILLIWCGRRVADSLLKNDAALSSGELELRVASPEGFRFCLKLIGVYALFRSLELLAQGATRAPWGPALQNSGDLSSFLLPFLPGALVLALAIYLLRGGKWLVRFAWPQWDEGE